VSATADPLITVVIPVRAAAATWRARDRTGLRRVVALECAVLGCASETDEAERRCPMILTTHFFFVHMEKTGGSFLAKLCRDHLPPTMLVTHGVAPHAPWAEVPERYRRLPGFTLVRNPWDWYVSWYHYMHFLFAPHRKRRATGGSLVWRTAFDSGRNNFKQTITNVCIGRYAHLNPLPAPDADLYTRRFLFMGGSALEAEMLEVGRVESLRDDFTGFLSHHEIPVPDGFWDAIKRSPAVNMGERGPYRPYYDAELRSLVGEKAGPIIDRYGYSF
jgi:hypothetical protein